MFIILYHNMGQPTFQRRLGGAWAKRVGKHCSVYLQITVRFLVCICIAEVVIDPECRNRHQKDSAFFFRTRIQRSVKNRTRSHFSISAVAGVCVIIFEVKTWVNFCWLNGGRILNMSRILKFEKFPDPGSNILKQEQSR